jgi:hypothetical protein
MMMPSIGQSFQAVKGALDGATSAFSVENHGKGVDSEMAKVKESVTKTPFSAIKSLGSGVNSFIDISQGNVGGAFTNISRAIGNAMGIGK